VINEPVNAILVDDQPGKLDALKRQLEDNETLAFSVTPFTDPYDALRYLQNNPGAAEFVFIDHVIVANRPPGFPPEIPSLHDGIDLARAISKEMPQIGIILYSGDEKITEADEWKALAAGAHRYVRVAPPQSLMDVATREFVAEIRELRELKQTLERFHEMWSTTDILQRSVRVGIDLIDRRFKVWYTNKQFTDIAAGSSNPNQFCCALFHNRDWPPCHGCLVTQGLSLTKAEWQKTQGRINRVFYSPIYSGDHCRFRYVQVWAEPVYPREESDMPIAVVESTIDLSDSPTLEQMGLEENLDIVMRAITELTCPWLDPKQVPIARDGRWTEVEKLDRRPGYTRVRVYRAGMTAPEPTLRGLRGRGRLASKIEDLQPKLLKTPTYEGCDSPIKTSRAVWVHDPGAYIDSDVFEPVLGCSEAPVEFLLFDSQQDWIGWLAVDAEPECPPARKLDHRDAEFLLPYAEEIARVLEAKLDRPDLTGAEMSPIVEEVQSTIVLASTSEEALQAVIDGIVGRCGIEMGHIRIIRGNRLHLAAGKGAYFDHAAPDIPTDLPHSLSRRVAATGLPLIANRRPNPLVDASIAGMPPEVRAAVRGVKSVGVFPLKAFGRVEAVLTLYGTQEEVFTGEVILLCTRLAEIASYALHDISVQAETAHKIEAMWRRAAAAFAHRIGNTLPAAQYRLNMILRSPDTTPQVIEDARVALDSVGRAIEIATLYRQHGSHIPLATELWRVPDLMRRILDHCQASAEQSAIDLQYDPEAFENVRVQADRNALKDVFSNLVRDSVSFHPRRQPRASIQCLLRSVSGPNAQLVINYRDDGPGVPRELKEAIFEPFVTTREEGTGIGLADARTVIQSHGGTIREIGIYGRGAHFEIVLPLQMAER